MLENGNIRRITPTRRMTSAERKNRELLIFLAEHGDPYARKKLKKDTAITKSQVCLLEEERREQVRKNCNSAATTHEKYVTNLRVTTITNLLNNSEIVEEISSDKIGVGVCFDIQFLYDSSEQLLHVELINQAVSTEMKCDYVERISQLGTAVNGLTENQEFCYIGKHNKRTYGVVSNIGIKKDKSSDGISYKKDIIK